MILCLLPGQVLLTLPAREGKPCVIAVEARHECGFVPPGLGASTCHSGSQRCQGEPGCGLATRAGGVGAARGECSGESPPESRDAGCSGPARRPADPSAPTVLTYTRGFGRSPSPRPRREDGLTCSAGRGSRDRGPRASSITAGGRGGSTDPIPGGSAPFPEPRSARPRPHSRRRLVRQRRERARRERGGAQSWALNPGLRRGVRCAALRLSEVDAQTPGAEAEAPEVPAASRQCGCQRAALC